MGKRRSRVRGQGFVEYALLVALVAAVTVLLLRLMGVSVRDVYCAVAGPLGLDDACRDESYFHDDFDGDLSAWEYIKGKWSVQDGKLVGDPGAMDMLIPPIDAADYVVRLEMAQLDKGNGYGVYFRANGAPKLDGYSFQYDPGLKAFVFRRWANGKELGTFARTPAPDYDWYGAPRTVEVVVQGDTFTAYVDGQAVVTGRDSTYTEGTAGLRTWDGSRFTVDSFTVDPIR